VPALLKHLGGVAASKTRQKGDAEIVLKS
jgi:hypothetical protein